SPSLTVHLARLPSVMVGESAGIRISIGMYQLLLVANLFSRLDDVLYLRQRQFFKIGSIWQWHFKASHTYYRRIEIIERMLHDLRGDLRADAGERPAFFHRHAAVGFLDRLDDGFRIERAQRAQVDDFGGDTFSRKLLGSLQGFSHHDRKRNDGHIA